MPEEGRFEKQQLVSCEGSMFDAGEILTLASKLKAKAHTLMGDLQHQLRESKEQLVVTAILHAEKLSTQLQRDAKRVFHKNIA